ncbi:hypothetical protein A7982_12074 [Minicystis rosea]|nr:hypothetical protein A7982_12074 [Minicystis rosea]
MLRRGRRHALPFPRGRLRVNHPPRPRHPLAIEGPPRVRIPPLSP